MHRDIIARARADGRTALDEAAAKALLADFSIRVPKLARRDRVQISASQSLTASRPLLQ